MSLLDDTYVFAVIIDEGGLNRAAKKLGLSNGLISRRLAQLEKRLNVTLLKRTTRQMQLTAEGELYWQYAKRIQQELNSAVSCIQSLANTPVGNIRISAPSYFGRHFLAPVLNQFMENTPDTCIDLMLSDTFHDPIRENIDILIRGSGYFTPDMQDSSLKIKLLLKTNIRLYASSAYLAKKNTLEKPEELLQHRIISYKNNIENFTGEKWLYSYKNELFDLPITPTFYCNDIETSAFMCLQGHGISKLTNLVYLNNLEQSGELQDLEEVLANYNWGDFSLFAVYPDQRLLPKRTRLLFDFIFEKAQELQKKLSLI